MASSSLSENALTPARLGTMRLFLWLSVVTAGIGLGAKLFDLLVVAGAWGASPPASFVHLPYGKDYPVDPSVFFQPLSALMLIAIVGALLSGWKSEQRMWLLIPLLTFIVVWAITPTVFWPMINEMWSIHKARISRSESEVISLVRRWIIWDSFRTGLIAIVLFSSLRALAGPIFSKKKND